MKRRTEPPPVKNDDPLRLCKKCRKNSTFMPDEVCSACRNDDDAENDKPDERR